MAEYSSELESSFSITSTHALTNSYQQPDTETDDFLSKIKSTINWD